MLDFLRRNFLALLLVALVGLLYWLHFLTGHGSVSGPGRGLDGAAIAEIDKTLASIPPSVQRRLVRHINSARSPEDLTRFPQEMRLEFEHGLPHGAGQEQPLKQDQPLNIDPALYGPNTQSIHGHRVPTIDFDRGFAQLLISRRPLEGYRDLREILYLDWDRWRKILELILQYFDARVFGRWDELPGGTGLPIMHAALLRTGKVLMIPSSTDTVIWDPASGVSVLPGATTGLTADLFCSGHSFLADGTLLAVGGGGGSPGAASSNQGWKFDPAKEKWTRTGKNMSYMRWYPTAVTLDDKLGRVLVTSGWTTGTSPAPKMEFYDPSTDSFTPVTAGGAVGEKLFGQTYPGLHVIQGSKTFYAPTGFGDCSQTAAEWVGTEPSGSFSFTSSTTGAWTNTGANVRTKGMSVSILRNAPPHVRIVTFGGGNLAASGMARSIDLSAAAPSWGFAFPMLEHRVHPNAVLLPDGKVFVSGGMPAVSVTPPTGGRSEMYNPDSGAIFEMDELNHPRHYHSVALLLPSGKVMTAGGASPGGCSLSVENTIEIYSPPYLFRGPRPAITSSPSAVKLGDGFVIDTHDPKIAKTIDRVVLVRPMAVTHQTDSEQRVITLKFGVAGSHLKVTAPDGSTPQSVAPRGYYLLFILNNLGVPSEGKFIRLT